MGDATASSAAPIVMPKLGLTMSEGLLAEWRAAPGDDIEPGQVLFVVETDKITNEIEASAAGRILKLLVEAGETVEVGAPVALWTGPAQMSEAVETASPTESLATQAPEAAPPRPRIRATPLARRLAAQAGLALEALSGTGPRGRVQAGDVRAALETRAAAPPAPKPLTAASPTPERSLRRLIAARVARSKAEIPHFYVSADADFRALENLRRELNDDPIAPRKVSVTALLTLAAVRALREHPQACAVWRDGQAAPLDPRAVGVAVDTPAGVMAPVIPVVGGPYQVAEALEAAVARARAGRLGPGDAGEAVIGLSNVGMFGVRALTPVIDPDQTFMLGVGAPRATFRPDAGGAPVAVREATLTLACDHRAIDGGPAARLLATIVEAIERPLRLLTWS